MPKFQVSTKKSLYKPVEVEIDGKTFSCKRITRDVLQKIGELDKEVGEGNLDAVYKRLELLLGKSKTFNKLDINQIVDITNFILRCILNPEKEEKNESGSGDEKSP